MHDQCPNRDELRQFLLGELHRSLANEIEEHFATCDNCLNVAEQLNKAGALQGDLRLHFPTKGRPPTGEKTSSDRRQRRD